MTYACTKCGRTHDGEPMRAWFAKRGKDPDRVKICAACVVVSINDMANEADNVLGRLSEIDDAEERAEPFADLLEPFEPAFPGEEP